MQRFKVFDSTGLAPLGVLYSGDLNLFEDLVAAQADFSQAISLGSLLIGETGLQLIRYGSLEARLTGALRTDGILRALGGLYAGAFTTTQRDAISAGSRPYGLIVLNTTDNRYEWNSGTDPSPIWASLGTSVTPGTLASRPAAGTSNINIFYLATDANGGTLYYSNGSTWTQVAAGVTSAPANTAIAQAILLSGTLGGRPGANSGNNGFYYFANDVNGGTVYQSNGSSWGQVTSGVTHATAHAPGGADALPWAGSIHAANTLASRPLSSSTNAGYLYTATDVNGGTLYESTGSGWLQLAHGVNIATGEITGAMILDGTITGADIAGLTVALGNLAANSVDSSKVVDGSLTWADHLHKFLRPMDETTLWRVQFGTTVVTTNAAADGTIVYANAFPTGTITVFGSNGDLLVGQWWPDFHDATASQFQFRASSGGGNGVVGVVRLNWLAIGY